MCKNIDKPRLSVRFDPMRHIKNTALISFCALFTIGFLLTGCQEEAESSETATTVEKAEDAPAPTTNAIQIDVEAALKERILGDPNAPIKISEHSSLTCGHCGNFHKTTFKQLKEKYIDTGKAYIVFADFPLNAPAFHATLSARCVPEDKYFDYIQELFETQDQWAYDVAYLTYLRSKAGDYGLNEAKFEACLNNTELQEGILERVRAYQTKHNLKSTPSFVINDKETLTGGHPLEAFEELFNKTE